jgi:hypothetical protein
MITNNSLLYSVKILSEIGRDILYFPFWWYSRGLLNTVLRMLEFLKQRQKALGLLVWIKNIHRPMYGQYDWQGMIISVFMRIVQIIIRSVIMLFWCAFALLAVAAWIILPIVVVNELIFQMHA